VLDPANTSTRITSVALVSMRARETAQPAPFHPPVLIGSRLAAGGEALRGLLSVGWSFDAAGPPRLSRLNGVVRFAVVDAAMERLLIRLEFERPSIRADGDWRVQAILPGIVEDMIDLRRTPTLILVVPRGKVPSQGRIGLHVRCWNILPYGDGPDDAPGPRLAGLSVERFNPGSHKFGFWRPWQVVDFTSEADCKKHLLVGWHEADALGAGSRDTFASLGGFYFESADESFVTMRVSAPDRGKGQRPQTLRISLNGVLLLDRPVVGREDVLLIVPKRAYAPDNYLRFDFECAVVAAGQAEGGAGGDRPVGIRIEKFVIEPLRVDGIL